MSDAVPQANRCYLGGYISVYSALVSGSRRVYTVLLDRERYDKVASSRYHQAEKRQYSLLRRICADKGIPITFTSFKGSEAVFGPESGGVAAEAGDREYISEERLLSLERPYLAAIDGIEDPYNFGQVLRSFYASGVDGVIVPKRNFFTASAIVARASAGASELLCICASDDVAALCGKLSDRGVSVYATAASRDALDVFKAEYTRPLCVVFGGERRGISKKIMEKCKATLCITYPRDVGVSLSASSAAAVVAFEIGRRLS